MKQRSKLERSRLVRRPASAAALFVLFLLPLSPQARANSSNLLPNGSFRSGTSGWTTSNAALTIASDGGVADYAIYRDGGASAARSRMLNHGGQLVRSLPPSGYGISTNSPARPPTTAADTGTTVRSVARSRSGSRASSTPPTASSPRAPSSSQMLPISNRGRRMSRSRTG